MATYYKYAERDASNQVNWSEITSNMVNSLKEVEAIRESKRKAINDATTELSTTLSEAPQGEHSGLNEFAMTYANNAQQMRLMQDQLLKSGQLKLRDYNIGRANLTEGTTQLFNLGKKYQAVYKEKMDRFENGDSGMQEQFQMAELEAFANFSNHEAYINPTNGQVSVGKLISETKSGKSITTMDRTPGSFITVQELNFSVAQKVDKYKLDNLDADIDRLATKYVKTFGPNFSIDDVRQMPEFNKMKQEMINKQMALGSQSVGSMLSDYVGIAPNGEAYSYTRDPNKQDENTILLVADPNQPGSGRLVPDFNSEIGKKQYKEAEGFIGREIEKQLGRTETKTEPSTSSKNEAENNRKEDEMISNVGLLMTGDETQVQTVIEYFRDLNPSTKKVRRTPNGIEVTFEKDGKLETRDIGFYVGEGENKKTKTVAQFIESASNLLTGKSKSGIKNILKRGGYDKDATFNDKLTEDYIADVDAQIVEDSPATYNTAIDKFVLNKFKQATRLFGTNDEDLIPKLLEDEEFKKLGIIARDTGINSYNITIPGIDGTFAITQDNLVSRLPEILKTAYKKLNLDSELRNRLSEMTDAEKKDWENKNIPLKVADILKPDRLKTKTKSKVTENKKEDDKKKLPGT